jgi:hypothetical protein
MDGYQRELRDFLVEHGASDINLTRIGKHPKLEFEFKGKHISYTISNSPSDHRAGANAIGDLRRMLGEPAVEEETPSRRLADMLPAAKERKVYKGKLALYANGTDLRFTFPPDLVVLLGITIGQKFETSRLDKDTWHLHKLSAEVSGPTVNKWGRSLYYRPPYREDLTKGHKPFSSTTADYTVVGDAIVAHLTATQLSPPAQGGRGVSRLRLGAASPAPAPAAAEPLATVPATGQEIALREELEDVSARLRYILALVQAAERQTGYRLVKLRRENEAEGAWVWRAPDIRLD